ncbi:DUF2690 domain-containing protein [Polymorphospora sp. NPDC051019]|uniref:DUF2690 domain-containing protein n=1 Tax=Polymorphospora sp. NPDC051019 TaxID=3155725 RepID=UPI0034372777
MHSARDLIFDGRGGLDRAAATNTGYCHVQNSSTIQAGSQHCVYVRLSTKGATMPKIIRVMALLVAIATSVVIPATASAAPPAGYCYGDYCSGMDPNTTRHYPSGAYCAADGETVAHSYTPNLSYKLVELRWSNRCGTNWVRANFGHFEWLEARQPWPSCSERSSEYKQGYVSNNGSYWWSRMIYSPTRPVYGSAMVLWGSERWHDTQTACV